MGDAAEAPAGATRRDVELSQLFTKTSSNDARDGLRDTTTWLLITTGAVTLLSAAQMSTNV